MNRPPRLPGFGPGPRRRGRVERSIDALATHLRSLGQVDAYTSAVITAARTTGAALDRLEADSERSEHVVGSVARVHAAILAELRPLGATGGDAFERLLAELAGDDPAAVRDPSTS